MAPKGFAPILIVILIAALVGLGGFLIYSQQTKTTSLPLQTNQLSPTPESSPIFAEQKQSSTSPKLTESSSQPQYGLTFEEYKASEPYPPNSIEAQRTTNGVLVTWPRLFSDITKESDLMREYRLYRRISESSDWQLITTVKSLPEKGPYSKPSNSYLDPTKESFGYAVTVVSIYGVEGGMGPIGKPTP